MKNRILFLAVTIVLSSLSCSSLNTKENDTKVEGMNLSGIEGVNYVLIGYRDQYPFFRATDNVVYKLDIEREQLQNSFIYSTTDIPVFINNAGVIYQTEEGFIIRYRNGRSKKIQKCFKEVCYLSSNKDLSIIAFNDFDDNLIFLDVNTSSVTNTGYKAGNVYIIDHEIYFSNDGNIILCDFPEMKNEQIVVKNFVGDPWVIFPTKERHMIGYMDKYPNNTVIYYSVKEKVNIVNIESPMSTFAFYSFSTKEVVFYNPSGLDIVKVKDSI